MSGEPDPIIKMPIIFNFLTQKIVINVQANNVVIFSFVHPRAWCPDF